MNLIYNLTGDFAVYAQGWLRIAPTSLTVLNVEY